MTNYYETKNWHEAANLFPLLPQEELEDLASDIEQNGLLNPVILLDHKVLDGRNRLLACKLANVKPSFVTWTQNGVSATDWVISQNLRRRHLTPGQRAAVAVEAKPLLAAEAKKNQERAGATNLAKYNGASSVLNNEKTSKPVKVEKTVAKQFDVSQGYVYAAQKIKDKDEKVFQQVKNGALSIPEAEVRLGFKNKVKAMVSSDSNEWYTPAIYVKPVHDVMGGVDLDPASCVLANTIVKATKFFDKEHNGLSKTWSGRVYMNPPYGDLGPKFVAKVLRDYEHGKIKEAIILLNSHCVDTKWFKPLFNHTLCFTDHRPKFWNEDGVGDAPTHGSVFVYLGKKNRRKFISVFQHIGSVVEKPAH